MKPVMGIIEIRNLLTDFCWYTCSSDTFKECADLRFRLDLGMFPVKSLQEDYENTGLELFDIKCIREFSDADEMKKALRELTEGSEKIYV